MTCGKCGAEGHNARTCGKSTPAKKSPAGKVAAAPMPETGTVLEQLRARRERCQREVATIDRVIADLESLEAGKGVA